MGARLLLFLAGAAAAAVGSAKPPHLVFVLTDDNGW